MSTYFKFLKNSFIEALTYRHNVLIGIFGKFVFLFVQTSLWIALYQGMHTQSQTLGDVINYTITTNLLFAVIDTNISTIINRKISTGEIAIDFMRPYSFFGYLLFYSLGKNLYNFLAYAFPLFIFSIGIYHIDMRVGSYIPLFLLSVLLSYFITFIFNLIIGLLAFWFVSTHQLQLFVNSFMKLFSGVWISIWFFPAAFKNISMFLPFQYMYYVPASILANQAFTVENVRMVGFQAVYLILLSVFITVLWRKGNKKLLIQGG